MKERFIVQQSESPNHFVCTDTENKIVCVFENHKFNDTQKMTMLENFNPDDMMKLAKYMREMGDWLSKNHYDKIF